MNKSEVGFDLEEYRSLNIPHHTTYTNGSSKLKIFTVNHIAFCHSIHQFAKQTSEPS